MCFCLTHNNLWGQFLPIPLILNYAGKLWSNLSQIALSSIQGLMAGYTNFAIGHLKNRVAMVPIREMMHNTEKFCLKPQE